MIYQINSSEKDLSKITIVRSYDCVSFRQNLFFSFWIMRDFNSLFLDYVTYDSVNLPVRVSPYIQRFSIPCQQIYIIIWFVLNKIGFDNFLTRFFVNKSKIRRVEFYFVSFLCHLIVKFISVQFRKHDINILNFFSFPCNAISEISTVDGSVVENNDFYDFKILFWRESRD